MADRHSIRDAIIRDLPATAADDPSTADVAEDWLDRAIDAAERWQTATAAGFVDSPEAIEAAYDVLAAWCGLRRLEPGLAADQGEVTRRLEDLVSRSGEPLARGAATVPNPEDWLEAARRHETVVEAAVGEPRTTDDLARRSWELLDELDEAELVACALDRLTGDAGRALHESLLECARYAATHADLFLPAVPYARALGEAVRRDLEEAEPDLTLTLLKFGRVLDEYRALLAEAAAESAVVMDRETVRAWLDELRRERQGLLERVRDAVAALADEAKRKVLVALPAIPEHRPVAAYAGARAPQAEGPRLQWEPEDGAWHAMLRLPAEAGASDDVVVELVVDGAPPGASVVLRGIVRRLEEDGPHRAAQFTLGELRGAWSRDDVPSLALVAGTEDRPRVALGVLLKT